MYIHIFTNTDCIYSTWNDKYVDWMDQEMSDCRGCATYPWGPTLLSPRVPMVGGHRNTSDRDGLQQRKHMVFNRYSNPQKIRFYLMEHEFCEGY